MQTSNHQIHYLIFFKHMVAEVEKRGWKVNNAPIVAA